MNFTLDFGTIIAALIPLLASFLIKSDGKSTYIFNVNINTITLHQNLNRNYHELSNAKNINNTRVISNVLFESPAAILIGIIMLLSLVTIIAIKYSVALNIITILTSIIFACIYFTIYFKVGNEKFNKALFIAVLLNVILSYIVINSDPLSLKIPNNLAELYYEIGFLNLLQDYGSIVNHLIISFFIRLFALIWLLVAIFELIFKKIRSKFSYPYPLLFIPFVSLFSLWLV